MSSPPDTFSSPAVIVEHGDFQRVEPEGARLADGRYVLAGSDARPVVEWRCWKCGTSYTTPPYCGGNREPVYGVTAQDVIDALRLVLTQDDAQVELIRELMKEAPATDEARGVDLLLGLIRNGRAQVTLR